MLKVLDVQKIKNKICHICKLEKGNLSNEIVSVIAKIDINKRKRTMANHTATHLLHKALKNTLGDHVQQAGSLVSDAKLRFDYTHASKLSDQEILSIENEVIDVIQRNLILEKEEKSYDEAIKDGAEALFGEKYEDSVRVVTVGEYSKELCGGTHVDQTGDIRLFKIVSEASLSSGVRRIEALTSDGCFNYYNKNNELINSISSLFNCDNDSVLRSIESLIEENKMLNSKIKKIALLNQNQMLEDLLKESEEHNGLKIISKVVEKDFDENLLSDNFRSSVKNKGVMLLGFIRN